MIDFTTLVTTRNGKSVRILCTDGPGIQPVIGIIDGFIGPSFWTLDGLYLEKSYNQLSDFDLINPPQKEVRYVNVYPPDEFSRTYFTRQDADTLANNKRIACIRIEFTPGQFDE